MTDTYNIGNSHYCWSLDVPIVTAKMVVIMSRVYCAVCRFLPQKLASYGDMTLNISMQNSNKMTYCMQKYIVGVNSSSCIDDSISLAASSESDSVLGPIGSCKHQSIDVNFANNYINYVHRWESCGIRWS